MSVRIQIVLGKDERETFRAQAQREGRSLSEWLREAGRARLESHSGRRLGSAEALRSFFAECDAREGTGREPDWDEHLTVISESRARGLPET